MTDHLVDLIDGCFVGDGPLRRFTFRRFPLYITLILTPNPIPIPKP